jgi:multimeric flavodoxin WrbA
MIDRLVCADGGNPDPTTTHGKNAAAAKAIELAGWSYPRHLAGRVFSVFVHGDTEGANGLRQNLHDWLVEMHLEPANADLARYIGYYEPYATSHDELDADEAIVKDCRSSMRVLADRAKRKRVEPPRVELDEARPK